MPKIQRALISVYEKAGVVEFARKLRELGIEILSTGGTAEILRNNGLDIRDVSDYTGFPEIMDGRVKTLHPAIYGGILARRSNPADLDSARSLGIELIDMLVINLYPFESTIAKPAVSLEEALENIDIGGPSMIRASAKNFLDVVVVTSPDDYAAVLGELESNNCTIRTKTSARLALKAFRLTAHYDSAISSYLSSIAGEEQEQKIFLEADYVSVLRYGENPHQQASIYRLCGAKGWAVSAEVLSGKELSFNNYLDVDSAYSLASEFREPAVIIIKHTNPCGGAVADSPEEAFERALEGDPVSAFGGILGLNRPINAGVAKLVARKGNFFECIIAPDYDEESLSIITSWNKDVRLLKAPVGLVDSPHYRFVGGALLLQDPDAIQLDEQKLQLVTKRAPTEDELRDLRFAWIIAKGVKSNAIVYAKNRMVVGVGAGQMSRVDSAKIASFKAGERAKGAVCASDAFFPFPDGIEESAKAGITAIIQPGGSKRDKEVVETADSYDIAMLFTSIRHFKH